MTTWKERIENNELAITTGDGKKWYPQWKKSVQDIEYNVSGFEAIDIEGTYVDRKRKKGDKLPITFFFQGEDCVDQAKLFEKSARDRRPWIFKHPFFDIIKVQPTKLKFDFTGLNAVKITGILWETIAFKFPRENFPPQYLVSKAVGVLYNDIVLTTVEEIGTPLPVNINPSQSFIDSLENIFGKIAETKDDIANVKELARKASSAAQNMVQDVTNFIVYTNDLIIFPLLLVQSTRSKIDSMIEAANSLKDIFFGVPEAAPEFYEAFATSLLASLSNLVVDGDYNKDTDVFYAIDKTTETYAEVRSSYDEISYIQNPNLALQSDIINSTTIASLYDIAFDTRRQRIIVLGEDSNMVLLAHKYYGPGDDKLEEFIEQNKLKGDEYLQIKAGREIIYFV
jgi:hypothetical protein